MRYMDFGNVEERKNCHLMALHSEFRLLPFQVCQSEEEYGLGRFTLNQL